MLLLICLWKQESQAVHEELECQVAPVRALVHLAALFQQLHYFFHCLRFIRNGGQRMLHFFLSI